MAVKKIFIFGKGDASVGISGNSATINAEGNFIVDPEDYDASDLEDVRQSIVDLFESLWNDSVIVFFDFEMVVRLKSESA